jgi:hypothetical protein
MKRKRHPVGYRSSIGRKSVEGWNWFAAPTSTKPLTPLVPRHELADAPIDLSCFDAFERRQITAWRRVGRPDVQSLEELNVAVDSWNEWEARGWPR